MGRLILILLAVFAVFMVISLVISALHFLFWVAIVALIVAGLLLAGRHAAAGTRLAQPRRQPASRASGAMACMPCTCMVRGTARP